jgi:hypothetical protein
MTLRLQPGGDFSGSVDLLLMALAVTKTQRVKPKPAPSGYRPGSSGVDSTAQKNHRVCP